MRMASAVFSVRVKVEAWKPPAWRLGSKPERARTYTVVRRA